MTPLLPPDLFALWCERASIMEFDANLPREVAERLALDDVRRAEDLRNAPARNGGYPK